MNPPENLTEKAKDIWLDIESSRNRKLNKADYTLIENFCHEVDLYDQAYAEVQDGNFVNKHNQVSPAVTVANKAANNIRQLYKSISKFLKDEGLESKQQLRAVKNF